MANPVTELNFQKLKTYLESATDLPYRNGEPNVTAIAREAGLKDRQPIYTNTKCSDLFADHVKKLPERGKENSENKKEKQQERRIRTLEAENAELFSKCQELKRKLRKLEHVEHLLERGKRPI